MHDNDILRFLEDFFKRTKWYTHEEKSILLMMLNYSWKNLYIENPDNINENYRIFELHTDSEKETFSKILEEDFEEDANGYALKENSRFWRLGSK